MSQLGVCIQTSQVKWNQSDLLRSNKETSEAWWETNLLLLVFRGIKRFSYFTVKLNLTLKTSDLQTIISTLTEPHPRLLHSPGLTCHTASAVSHTAQVKGQIHCFLFISQVWIQNRALMWPGAYVHSYVTAKWQEVTTGSNLWINCFTPDLIQIIK